MTTYAYSIRKCSKCNAEFASSECTSSNSLGATLCTDGYLDGRMVDHGTFLYTCPRCHSLLWDDEAPIIGPDLFDAELRRPIERTDYESHAECLRRHGIECLGDLIQCTEQELLDTACFDEPGLDILKKKLGSQGLSLGMRFGEELPGESQPRRPVPPDPAYVNDFERAILSEAWRTPEEEKSLRMSAWWNMSRLWDPLERAKREIARIIKYLGKVEETEGGLSWDLNRVKGDLELLMNVHLKMRPDARQHILDAIAEINRKKLKAFLDEDDDSERIMKAEICRQDGAFGEAVQLLARAPKDPDLQDWADTVADLSRKGIRDVREVVPRDKPGEPDAGCPNV